MNTRISNDYGWESPHLMHTYSNVWDSKLNFISKEVEFLKNLLHQNVYSIVGSELSREAEKFIQELGELKIEMSSLIELIHDHKNKLKILFSDLKNTEQSWAYKHEHRKLMIKMHEFDSKYQNLKKSVFRTIKKALKHHKQKFLPEKS
ncbi:hypothetical protein [Gramella sp. MAR_2010_147]|uniref:hypothetical protein n=1 Tax=Gramella sp. MAR_2010_147 TaxID=1250205 RepID=UPI0008796605|nr:hypothetical protein [Gramella sp. MAR_2010_147]SDR92576.1 hypothetical protein SAMN04488553_1048 [Gramella sp. MAR_2010_147]